MARLKGGDPFIFGRGGEEAEALVEANIEWEVIPGVSSGIAAAAYAGIPLTHRDYSSSVAFITGHDAAHGKRPAVDWSIAAHAADTLVIFMCAQTITRIARESSRAGRDAVNADRNHRLGNLPASGSFHRHARRFGCADEIVEAGLKIAPPAIAVIGDVVRLAENSRGLAHSQFEHLLGASAAPLTSINWSSI